MNAVVVTFIENVVVHGKLEWVEWKTDHYAVRSTIDRGKGLLIKATLSYPSSGHRGYASRTSNRKSSWIPFDIATHTHWFDLRIEDPLFRWGRKVILHIIATPNDEEYAFLRRVYEGLESVRTISHDRAFESKTVAVGKALMELTAPLS